MNSKLKKILLLKLTFVALTIYINIFINYFFWQKTGDLKMILLFTMVQWVFWMIPYSLGTLVVLKNARWNYYISSGSAVLTFVTLWLFSDKLEPMVLMVVVALSSSLINTFFYASNTLAFLASAGSSKEMNRYISLEGSLTTLVSFVLPFINALIIFWLGFEWSFLFMVMVSVGYFYLTLTAVEVKKVSPAQFKAAMKSERFTPTMWFYNFISMFASRSMMILGSVILIVISSNELQISFWNGVSVIVVFVLGMVMRRFPAISLKSWAGISLVLLILTAGMVGVGINLMYIIVLQSCVVYLSRFIELSLPMKAMRRKNTTGKLVLSYKREMIINWSRIIMIVGLYGIFAKYGMEALIYVILSTSGLATGILISISTKIEKELERDS